MSSPTQPPAEPPDEWFDWYMPEDQDGAWQCGRGHMFRYEPPPASPPWCPKPGCHAGNFRWIIKDEVTSKDWLPDKPGKPELPRLPKCYKCNTHWIDDSVGRNSHESIWGHKPEVAPAGTIESVLKPHGLMQVLPPGPLPEPRELSPEEQQKAAFRYMQAKYADQADMYQVEWKLPTPSGDEVRDQAAAYDTAIHQQIEKHYTDMVHRNPDGPDPLVDEPGP